MNRMIVVVGVMGIVCAAATAQAQEDLRKLDVWVGDWAWESLEKDSPSGAERKVEGTGEFRRLGDHFLVWNSQWKDAEGNEHSVLEITEYDPVKKACVVHSFGSQGGRGTAVMTIDGKTVTFDWTGVTATGEETRTRCKDVLEDAGPNSCETLTDGTWWASSKGTSRKVK